MEYVTNIKYRDEHKIASLKINIGGEIKFILCIFSFDKMPFAMEIIGVIISAEVLRTNIIRTTRIGINNNANPKNKADLLRFVVFIIFPELFNFFEAVFKHLTNA